MIMHELCNEYAIICNYMQWMFVPWYIAEPYNASYFDCSHAQHDNSKLFPREFKMDKFNWILFLKALQSPVLFLEGLRSSSMNSAHFELEGCSSLSCTALLEYFLFHSPIFQPGIFTVFSLPNLVCWPPSWKPDSCCEIVTASVAW